MMNIKMFGASVVMLAGVMTGGLSAADFFTKVSYHFKGETRMVVVGDVMLGRHVETLMGRNSQEYPFVYVEDFLSNADITIGNLEGVIQKEHIKTPINQMRFSFDKNIADLLLRTGFDAVFLGNNHSFDYGRDGYNETKSYLKEVDIKTFGSAVSVGEESYSIFSTKYEDVIFISINDTFGTLDEVGGVELIKSLQTKKNSFIFISVHWGEEYKLSSNTRQQRLAHLFIDAGADAVIGHHPHVVQEIEVYKEKPIFYSLGNFVFDQYFSDDVEKGLSLEIVLKGYGVDYILHGVTSEMSQPQFMEKTQADSFLKSLALRSDENIREDIQQGILEFDY